LHLMANQSAGLPYRNGARTSASAG